MLTPLAAAETGEDMEVVMKLLKEGDVNLRAAQVCSCSSEKKPERGPMWDRATGKGICKVTPAELVASFYSHPFAVPIRAVASSCPHRDLSVEGLKGSCNLGSFHCMPSTRLRRSRRHRLGVAVYPKVIKATSAKLHYGHPPARCEGTRELDKVKEQKQS